MGPLGLDMRPIAEPHPVVIARDKVARHAGSLNRLCIRFLIHDTQCSVQTSYSYIVVLLYVCKVFGLSAACRALRIEIRLFTICQMYIYTRNIFYNKMLRKYLRYCTNPRQVGCADRMLISSNHLRSAT